MVEPEGSRSHSFTKKRTPYGVRFFAQEGIELARTVVLVSALATLGSLLRKASPKSLQATFVITYIVRYGSQNTNSSSNLARFFISISYVGPNLMAEFF